MPQTQIHDADAPSEGDVRARLVERRESEKFEADGWALCCSGGGYKSAAFQVGAYIRLNELGVLRKLKRIASVSGGSIPTAFLGLNWSRLVWDGDVAVNLHEVFVEPMTRFLTSANIDASNILQSLLPWRTGAEGIEKAYAKRLFGAATLQDFPDEADAPRFVILATNFELNTLWRFSRPYAADHRVGMVMAPRFSLAKVVAASSGFPPFFCPVRLDFSDHEISKPGAAAAAGRSLLADGGIYDNMGLEPIWKRYGVLLVSNAGDPLAETESPGGNWYGIVRRSMSMIHRQAENNRVRWLLSLADAGVRRVAYWPLRSSVAEFDAPGSIALSPAEADLARAEAVRLKALRPDAYRRLVRHGYSLCDAAVRRWLKTPNKPAPQWPL